ALADREAAVVELTGAAGFREADPRHGLLVASTGAFDQLHEGVDAGPGRGERFGDRFGRWPALAAVRRDALGFVEGGRVEAGLLGEAGCREPGTFGEPVERSPDLGVS